MSAARSNHNEGVSDMNTAARIPDRREPACYRVWLAAVFAVAFLALPALGQISTTPTMNPADFEVALHPTGLSINDISIKNGVDGQFGTFSNFELRPITIRPGVVLSSGSVANLRPFPEAHDPNYDPASPPPQVSNQMNPEPITGATPEFDAYGFTAGNIENFNGSFDVAAMRVDFTLENDSPVKFDFIFGSVEFPFYTGSFTDSFLVFLDGFEPVNQITFDVAGNAVQVGSSFAGLETTQDLNTAFSNPHGLIHHLTTTTARLDTGHHFLTFEVGDVNDHILDSAVFIANLRAEDGPEGTGESDDPPYVGCPHVNRQPASATVCPGANVTLSVSASGDAPLSYRWRRDGVAIDPAVNPSAVTPTLSLLNVQNTDSGRYACRVSNGCGDETTDAVRLTVTVRSDMNCDGVVNNFDIDPFVLGLTNPAGYVTTYPTCELFNGDVNCDGAVNNFDIDPFVQCLVTGCR
jgi:hypothetical protein